MCDKAVGPYASPLNMSVIDLSHLTSSLMFIMQGLISLLLGVTDINNAKHVKRNYTKC